VVSVGPEETPDDIRVAARQLSGAAPEPGSCRPLQEIVTLRQMGHHAFHSDALGQGLRAIKPVICNA